MPARITIETVDEYSEKPSETKKVFFACFSDADYEVYSANLRKL